MAERLVTPINRCAHTIFVKMMKLFLKEGLNPVLFLLG